EAGLREPRGRPASTRFLPGQLRPSTPKTSGHHAMSLTLLGRKIGMTRYFREDGTNIPVTVLEVGPCVVTQIRTPEVDGYSAVQIGYGEAKPRTTPMPMIGHDAKAGTT